MSSCRAFASEDRVDGLARITAEGALLHLIQDSYSQSHTVRGTPHVDHTYEARADCYLPTHFYTYWGQLKHGVADRVPELGATCGNGGEADDVITASAMAIYYVSQRPSTPEVFEAYLQDRVFGHS